jgi:serine/threonine protein phosphatase PrpC
MWNPFKRHLPNDRKPETPKPVWRLSVALQTDQGCLRNLNQDSARFLHSSNDLLGIVADGMGGHRAGEIASLLAVDVVCRAYVEAEGPPSQRLQNALIAANQSLYRASGDESLAGMGTTCTALAISDGFAYLAHVGDSRLYLIRSGQIYQMTEDHSHVMELVRKGAITAEQAREHPDRNILHRALGRHDSIEIYCWPKGEPLQDGDLYLLCSDGLSGVLSDETIRRVATENDPHTACIILVDLTRRAGAPDNLTVGIVAVHALTGADRDLPPTRELEMAARENDGCGAERS